MDKYGKTAAIQLKTRLGQDVIVALVESSNLSSAMKANFLKLAETDPDLAGNCLRSAEKLQLILVKNQERVSGAFFSFFRKGTIIHSLLTKNLNEAITSLSQGNNDEAKSVIKQTMNQLKKLNSVIIPELKMLNSVYSGIHSHVDQKSQMSIG